MPTYTQGDSFEKLPVPGFTKPTHTWGETFGDEFHAPVIRELLGSTVGWRQRGIVVAGGQGILPTGTVLAQATADKKYYVYNASLTGTGKEVPLGFLRHAVDTGGSGDPTGAPAADVGGNLVDAGIVKLSVASGLDTNAVTKLAGRQDNASGFFYF